jgi:hypothetical protein
MYFIDGFRGGDIVFPDSEGLFSAGDPGVLDKAEGIAS